MKVVLSCIGKFHHFDLARELEIKGMLGGILTSYPKFKLTREGIPMNKISSFPWLQAPYMASVKLGGLGARLGMPLGELSRRAHDRWAASVMPKCDVFIGLSGHNLLTGRRAKALGARWICDRGSTHISYQHKVLLHEYSAYGLSFRGVHPAVIVQEQAEYRECDLVTVPSAFTFNTFVGAGVSLSKLRKVSYGVNLDRFFPVGSPNVDSFDVIFIGTVTPRKGVRFLIEAFRGLKVPRKTLTVIGPIDPDLEDWLATIKDSDINFKGPLPQAQLKEHLSRSHVFVLPSIEEGLALVQAQAMACGCPVICSAATGGLDLFTDGVEGYAVPVGDVNALTNRMQLIADSKELRARMAAAALAKVRNIGGWSGYGREYISVINNLLVS